MRHLFLLLILTNLAQSQNCNPNGTVFTEVTPKAWTIYQMQYSLYIGTGSFTVLGNLVVLLALMPKKELAKKYFLALFLAFGDMTLGLAYLTAGIHRLIMVVQGAHRNKVTQWDCFARPYTTFFAIGSFLPVLLTTLISFERFLAITWPVKFAIDWPTKKIFGSAAFICVLLTAMFCGAGAYNAWTSKDCYGNFCFTSWGVGPDLNSHKQSLVIACVGVMSFFYTMATISMLGQKRKLKDATQNSANRKRLETQVRITKTFLVIVVTTVIFVMLPNIGGKILNREDTKDIYVYISPFFWALHCLNSGISFVVYMVFNKELRNAMLGVIVPWYSPNIEATTVGPSAASNKVRSSKVRPVGANSQQPTGGHMSLATIRTD